MMWLFWAFGLTLSTLAAIVVVRRARSFGIVVFATLLACYVVCANVLVPRLINFDIGIMTLVVASGSLIWPFTSQLTDMINEIYGRRYAWGAIALAYLANMLFVSFVFAVGSLPATWDSSHEHWWRDYFYTSGRILIASSLTFLIVGFLDVWLFAELKRFAERYEVRASTAGLAVSSLLRSVVSDASSMVLDSILFAVLAFAFVLSWSELNTLIVGSVILKVIMAVIDTPWFVAFRLATRHVQRDDLDDSPKETAHG